MDAQIVNFQKYYDEFTRFTSDIDDAVPRGILKSEAFFVRALIGDIKPMQLIESGRAQGQSTLLLAKSLPHLRIISIERDYDHVDSKIALNRLNSLNNVCCLFGDSKKILPDIALEGDVVVIDGPKDMDALWLLKKISEKTRISCAFIHDAHRGSLLRMWLDRFRKNLLYSDKSDFLARYCHLDRSKSDTEIKFWSNANNYPTQKVYSGTFSFLQAKDLKFSILDSYRIFYFKMFAKYTRSLKKRLGLKYKTNHPCG